nr:hypothetical protein CFP56_43068 [Quercus suber]
MHEELQVALCANRVGGSMRIVKGRGGQNGTSIIDGDATAVVVAKGLACLWRGGFRQKKLTLGNENEGHEGSNGGGAEEPQTVRGTRIGDAEVKGFTDLPRTVAVVARERVNNTDENSEEIKNI